MFQKRKRKCKRRKKYTETTTIDGVDIVICSNKPIKKKGAIEISEYVATGKNDTKQFDVIAELIKVDFFAGCYVQIKIKQVDDVTIWVKICR